MAETPCIASDSVKRPSGTTIFKNKDVDDFANKITSVLENLNNTKQILKKTTKEKIFTQITEVYNNTIKYEL